MVFHPNSKLPYYAVIFSSQMNSKDSGYIQMAEQMVELAKLQEGYLGIDSCRSETGFGVTVSYWKTKEAIQKWKKHVDHIGAQRLGRERWYQDYHLHIAKIEREYSQANSKFI